MMYVEPSMKWNRSVDRNRLISSKHAVKTRKNMLTFFVDFSHLAVRRIVQIEYFPFNLVHYNGIKPHSEHAGPRYLAANTHFHIQTSTFREMNRRRLHLAAIFATVVRS